MNEIALSHLKQTLIRHEGLVQHAYQDSRGYWTIGVGRLIDGRLNGGISKEEALYLLDNDVKIRVAQARRFPWFDGLNNARKEVIISMLFNLGISRFSNFVNMIGAIENRDFEAAARHGMDSKWAQQVGKRAEELMEQLRTGHYE